VTDVQNRQRAHRTRYVGSTLLRGVIYHRRRPVSSQFLGILFDVLFGQWNVTESIRSQSWQVLKICGSD
jgi:hypothetical protein